MGNRLLVIKHCGQWIDYAHPSIVAEKFDRVREAGFDGMAIDLGALTMEQAEATVPHFSRTGLAGGLTVPDLGRALRRAAAGTSDRGPVRGRDRSGNADQARRHGARDRGMAAVAEQESMPIQFETHRNCITNDLFTTAQLLDAVARHAAGRRSFALRRGP